MAVQNQMHEWPGKAPIEFRMTQQIIPSLNMSLLFNAMSIVRKANFSLSQELERFEQKKRIVNSNTGRLLHAFVQAGRPVLANLCA